MLQQSVKSVNKDKQYMVSITAKHVMVWCDQTIKLANNQKEGELLGAMSKSKETERWHDQTEKTDCSR